MAGVHEVEQVKSTGTDTPEMEQATIERTRWRGKNWTPFNYRIKFSPLGKEPALPNLNEDAARERHSWEQESTGIV